MHRRILVFFSLLALAATLGCSSTMVSQSVNGKAYLVKGSVFGTQAYNCMNSGDGPTCFPVVEEKLK